jgi:hypothetical protein
MSLSSFLSRESEAGDLVLASAVRIGADHLRGLKGPAQTLVSVEGLDLDIQENKTRRILPGASRPNARLAWPAIKGKDALSGLPCIIVIQAGALRYEVEKLARLERGELEPIDPDASTGGIAFALLNTWISGLVTAKAGLLIWFEGEGKTQDGQIFPRFRLAVVKNGADKLADYRAAWLADARALEAAAPAPAPVAALDVEPAPAADPIPF